MSSKEETAEVAPHRGSALTARDILNGVCTLARFILSMVEQYNPHCFAQQLRLFQGSPDPYLFVVGLRDWPTLCTSELADLSARIIS